MTNAAKFASSLTVAGDWLGFTAISEQQKVTQKQSNMDQFSESSFRSQTCFLEGHGPHLDPFFCPNTGLSPHTLLTFKLSPRGSTSL